MKASVFIATSLDGYIARTDGGIDWLTPDEGPGDGEDYGYQAFMDSVDALVMGRNTFDLVLSFASWPYGEKPVVVLTSRPVEIPEAVRDTVTSLSGPPGEIVRRLSERGFGRLYVDGGQTIQGFLREGLIDELILTRLPILLGDGIPLFGRLPHDIHLRHLGTRAFETGLVQSRYALRKPGA